MSDPRIGHLARRSAASVCEELEARFCAKYPVVMNEPVWTVAHCVAGHRPQPFISDPATNLPRYAPIVLARDRIDLQGWGSVPVYTAQDAPGWSGPDFMEPGPSFDDLPEAFLGAMTRHGVRLMHAHHGMFALEFLALRAAFGLPLIVSFYGYDASAFPRSSAANAARLRRLFDQSDRILAMSSNMRRDLLHVGCPADKVAIVRPAVDPNRFSYSAPPSVDDGVRILTVSDFSSKKGMLTLVEAFTRVAATRARASLEIVGSPTATAVVNYAAVRRRVDQLGLEGAVSFRGWIPYADIALAYRNCHIFALASQTSPDGNKEGVPAVILEAMAVGRPVVSTKHAGIPEVVGDGISGILVAEGDVPSLAAALVQLHESAPLRAKMGETARRRIETEFSLVRQCRDLEEVYDSVLSAPRPRPGPPVLPTDAIETAASMGSNPQ